MAGYTEYSLLASVPNWASKFQAAVAAYLGVSAPEVYVTAVETLTTTPPVLEVTYQVVETPAQIAATTTKLASIGSLLPSLQAAGWSSASALTAVVAPHLVQTFLPEVASEPTPPAPNVAPVSQFVYLEVMLDVYGYTEASLTLGDVYANAVRQGLCAYLEIKGAGTSCAPSNVFIVEVESLPYNTQLGYSAQVSAYVGVLAAEGAASLVAFRQFDSESAVAALVSQGLELCFDVTVDPGRAPTLTQPYVMNAQDAWVSVLPTQIYTAARLSTGSGYTGYTVAVTTRLSGNVNTPLFTVVSRMVEFISQLAGVDPAYVTAAVSNVTSAAPLRRSMLQVELKPAVGTVTTASVTSADVTFTASLGSAAAAQAAQASIPTIGSSWPDAVAFLSTRASGVAEVTVAPQPYVPPQTPPAGTMTMALVAGLSSVFIILTALACVVTTRPAKTGMKGGVRGRK